MTGPRAVDSADTADVGGVPALTQQSLPTGGYGSASGGPPPADAANQITRILATFRRFTWLIALVTVVGTAGGVVVSRFLEPEYSVGATMWIETGGNPRGGPIQAPELLSSYNWVELIRTFAVLDPVVNQVKLYLRPGKGIDGPNADLLNGFELSERFWPGGYLLTVDDSGKQYSLKTAAGLVVDSGSVSDSVGRAAGFKWLPGPTRLTRSLKAAFSLLTPRDASTDLNARLTTKMTDDKGNFLRLTLTGTDPALLETTMNAIQRQFVSVAADLKKQKLRELSTLLREQVGQQDGKLRQAEQALESFKVATITQPKEDVPVASGLQLTQSSAYTRYFQQRVEIETIKHERREIQEVLGRLAQGEITVDAFQTIPAVKAAPDLGRVLTELSSADADLRALRTKYTDESPFVKDLQQKISTMRQSTIPTYAQALVREMMLKESNLEARMNSAGDELKGIPMRAITESRLQRDMESAKVLSQILENRYEEAKLAEISAIPDVRIHDPAVAPTRPTKNRAPQVILLGIGGSLALGIALALLLDRTDKRFRYPDQASNELGLTLLGAVPVIPRSKNGRPVPHEETAQVVEAFRSIRLNLAHSFEPGTPICMTISSPSPGDGKSLIASNLALSFAEAGYRTLLLDGDARRGELHRTFGADRRPGLLDYLSGSSTTVEQILRPTSHRKLTLVPCGTRLHNGPELLGSARMAELIAKLRSQYDVVLVDSPPLGAGIDPFVLGTHTGQMLIVLRSGQTDRLMAEAKLRILDRLPVRLLGAVLNHIQAGVGPYKYYSYSYGYAAEDELGAVEGQSKLPESEGAARS